LSRKRRTTLCTAVESIACHSLEVAGSAIRIVLRQRRFYSGRSEISLVGAIRDGTVEIINGSQRATTMKIRKLRLILLAAALSAVAALVLGGYEVMRTWGTTAALRELGPAD